MRRHLERLGTALGVLGLLVCAMAVAGRFYGERELFGFQAINFFILGIGAITTACWAKLEARADDALR
jgi:hypothetical protein